MRGTVALLLVTACGGAPRSAAPDPLPACGVASYELCTAAIGPVLHECTDGAGHVCALCSPLLDGCRANDSEVRCVAGCWLCAMAPLERKLGITCSRDTEH